VHTLCQERSVTARVTTLKGPEAGAYYVEARPSYYLDAGEPRGRWHGHGAALLGLSGDVDDAAFLAVMAGDDPSGTVRLGRRYGSDSVRGFDITASAPKSVSVLFAVGDPATRRQVLAAHDAAVSTGSSATPTPGTGSTVRWPPSTQTGSSPPGSGSTPPGSWTRSCTPMW
jgi:hypothetical protein